ncbi:family 16 glycosylhydrolase [Haloferula sp. A504]|uniref:family 16 glycosylhydrolase n=1 Tax=Haloferula sp. A504 TaxID=3373601 RepID=UPI0031BFA109|nr:family 16 glycosylhydrolase [Verrucomicrobiaceae bacterium E54]
MVFSDTFNYGTTSAFIAEGGWTFWSGTGGSAAGSGFCWGNPIVLEYEHPTPLAAGETITMDAVLNRPWSGYLYGMRIVLWDGTDDASRVEVAGDSYQGNALPQVSYAVTPADITAGRTHVIFRYSHDGNWGETQEVSFAVDAAPTGWTWGNAAGGSWATVGDWSPDGPADAADQSASIHLLDITGEQTLTLDGSYTIGSIIFGDAAGADGNWILDPGTGGSLTLSAPTTGPPGIEVFNQTATLNTTLTGTEGVTKSGPGTLVLGAANTYTGGTTAPIDRDGWNTYGAEWDANKIVFTVNGKPTMTYPKVPDKGAAQWPFDQPFYLIFSMQIGGKWVGEADPDDYPAHLEIDWVRVYEKRES